MDSVETSTCKSSASLSGQAVGSWHTNSDQDGALAAIAKMLSAAASARTEALAAIRAVVSAAGEVTGEQAKRLARIETIL